jgi:SAM-dependent methyltransferase
MSSYSRQQLEAWLRTIEVKNQRVLDVGGSQKPLTGRLKTFQFQEYRILDLPVPHEEQKKPDYVGDLNYFMQGTENFDVVFAIEVMEYMWNPMQALMNINRYLRKGGLLHISFHFIYPVHNPVDQDFLRYTPNGVRKLLQETGFEILEETPRVFSDPQMVGYAIGGEGMRPAKGYNECHLQGLLVKAQKI